MMNRKAIKVIKRNERNRQEVVDEKKGKESPKEAARDMVATVTAWVNEFQQKRRTETARAFNTLFVDPAPRPSGA
jgi:hypothetical protein